MTRLSDRLTCSPFGLSPYSSLSPREGTEKRNRANPPTPLFSKKMPFLHIGLVNYEGNHYNSDERAHDIKAVLFGKDVTKIPNYLCKDLTGLTNIIIPDNVEEIGDYAFCECIGLTEVTIGKKVTSIGRYTFYMDNHTNLKKIYCKAQQPPIIDLSFPNSVSVIYVPRESVEEYRVVWSDFASKILGYDFE